nr:type II secretion system protein N [Legionella londiniensis]
MILLFLIFWQIASGMRAVAQYRDLASAKNIALEQPISQDSFAVAPALNAPLFGEYIPEKLNKIQQSMLNLEVVGIILADQEENSQVIIRMSDGEEQSFRMGDSLPGGALIKKITEEGILVIRNGTLESLSFPKNELIFEPPAKALVH